MSSNALDPVLHRNAHIIYTAEGNVLDAGLDEKKNETLYRYCLFSRIFWHIADYVTSGRFSSERRERVFKAMQTTLIKINKHLEEFKTHWEGQNEMCENQFPKDLYNACNQLVTYPKGYTYCNTEPLASLKDRISLISTSNFSAEQKDRLLLLALEISATVSGIKDINLIVHDTPVIVAGGVPSFEKFISSKI